MMGRRVRRRAVPIGVASRVGRRGESGGAAAQSAVLFVVVPAALSGCGWLRRRVCSARPARPQGTHRRPRPPGRRPPSQVRAAGAGGPGPAVEGGGGRGAGGGGGQGPGVWGGPSSGAEEGEGRVSVFGEQRSLGLGGVLLVGGRARGRWGEQRVGIWESRGWWWWGVCAFVGAELRFEGRGQSRGSLGGTELRDLRRRSEPWGFGGGGEGFRGAEGFWGGQSSEI